MKKTMAVLAVMTMVLSFGTAFAGDIQATASDEPYNGITYFDLGPAPACDTAPAKASQEKEVAFSNGITVFDEGQDSGAKGSCANQAAKQIMMTGIYNGVTVF